MRIKEIADHTGVPIDSIRHYEKAGLLRDPARTDNGYRRYVPADADRLRFIRNCRALDMSLDEVRTLLDFIDQPQADCTPVDLIVAEHLAHVRERLATLAILERQLENLLAACSSTRSRQRCGIVLALSGDASSTPKQRRGVHSA